jgi:hypothetical protein
MNVCSIHHQNCPPSHVIVCLLHHHGYPIAALCPFSLFSFSIFVSYFRYYNQSSCAIKNFLLLSNSSSCYFCLFVDIDTCLVAKQSKQLNVHRRGDWTSVYTRAHMCAHEHCRLKIMHTMRTTRKRKIEENITIEHERKRRIVQFFCLFSLALLSFFV